MYYVYAWINPTDIKSNNTLVVYGFSDVEKMVEKLSYFKDICDQKNISFKYNIVEQLDD